MNYRVAASALTLLLLSCAAPEPNPEQERPPLELQGRVAGAPQHCVMLSQSDSLRQSENNRHTLIYGSGRTIFANDLGECRFRADDVLVTEPNGSELCSGDIVRSLDRVSHIAGPSCVLGAFVPYSR